MENKKKLAAAVAAVFTHIRTHEDAAAMAQAAPLGDVSPEAVPVSQVIGFPEPNLWGQSGRQSQMQLRSMMQMRMFK